MWWVQCEYFSLQLLELFSCTNNLVVLSFFFKQAVIQTPMLSWPEMVVVLFVPEDVLMPTHGNPSLCVATAASTAAGFTVVPGALLLVPTTPICTRSDTGECEKNARPQ